MSPCGDLYNRYLLTSISVWSVQAFVPASHSRGPRDEELVTDRIGTNSASADFRRH
jgi:hypothetical protein